MSKKKVRPESAGETLGSETAQPVGTTSGLTKESHDDVDVKRREILIAWQNGKTLRQIAEETGLPEKSVYRSLQHVQKEIIGEGQNKNLTDYEVHESPSHRDPAEGHVSMSREDLNIVTISASEFAQLSAKTAEILEAAALAYERIARDQEEIEQLKTETRALLAGLRAA